MITRQYIIVFLLFLFFHSCKKEKVLDNSIDYSYFPLDTGNYIIYSVKEINIDNPSNIYDTTEYQLKELVESTFEDDDGNIIYRIERYKRSSDSSLWQIKDIWKAELTKERAEKTEENQRFIKIVFPVKLNEEWNGNAFNNLQEENYEITDLDTNEVINNIEYNSVLTVTQANDSSLIDKYYKVEKYAKNIGLIYKYKINVVSDIFVFDPALPIEQRIDTGKIYEQKILNYSIK